MHGSRISLFVRYHRVSEFLRAFVLLNNHNGPADNDKIELSIVPML